MLLRIDKQLEVQLSFPPHNEDQEIIIGSQVYPSGSAIPPHKPSRHMRQTVPGSRQPTPGFIHLQSECTPYSA